jgi:hypothetical protein
MICLCLTVAIALILASGPILQNSIMGLLNGNSASIYDAANGTEVIPFISLAGWLRAAVSPSFLIMGLFIACATLQTQTPRKMFLWSAMAGFLSLTVNDALHWNWATVNAREITEAVSANFAGSILLSTVIILWADILDRIRVFSAESIQLYSVLACPSIILLGLLSSVALYYISDFFLRPLPVRIDMFMSAPVHGALATKQAMTTLDDPPFSIFPKNFSVPLVDWSSPQAGLDVSWTALDKSTGFDASITFLSDCLEASWLKKTGQKSQSYSVKDVRNIQITFENGADDFWILDSAPSFSKLTLKKQPVTIFGIEPENDGEGTNLWQFVEGKTELRYEDSDEALSFYIGTPVFELKDETIRSISKKINVVVNGIPYPIEFTAQPGNSKDKVNCRTVPSKAAFETGVLKSHNSGISAGVKIDISARASENLSIRPTQLLSANGKSGWISLHGMDKERLSKIGSGILNLIEAEGNVSIDIDGNEQKVRPTDRFLATGVFRAQALNDGRIRIYGDADSLTKNQVRINPTKFESAKTLEQLTFLFPTLTLLIGALFFPIRTRLQRNGRFCWTDDDHFTQN